MKNPWAIATIINGKPHYFTTVPGNFDSDMLNSQVGWVVDLRHADRFRKRTALQILRLCPIFAKADVFVVNIVTKEVA